MYYRSDENHDSWLRQHGGHQGPLSSDTGQWKSNKSKRRKRVEWFDKATGGVYSASEAPRGTVGALMLGILIFILLY